MSLFTPVNQVRLTNVATVKLQKKGKRFEIACYRNKVLSWRNKVETDLREVLQIDSIFSNVSKGQLASAKDLVDVFGTSDHQTICKEILDKGELQVSEQERGALYESISKDIASIVADKTINPETNRPYTVNMIQNAMKQIQFSVNMSKSSKSQALEVIRKLKDVMPIARANMLLRVVYREVDSAFLSESLQSFHATVHSTSSSTAERANSSELFMDIIIDPENFRRVEEIVSSLSSGPGRVDVLQMRMLGGTQTVGAAESKGVESSSLIIEEITESKASSRKAEGKGVKAKGQRDTELASLLAEIGAITEEDLELEHDGPTPSSSSNKTKKNKKKNSSEQIEKAVESQAIPIELSKATQKTKVSKKSKRDEREEREDMAQKAKELHDRISQEKLVKSIQPPSSEVPEGTSPSVPIGGAGQRCNTCGGSFPDPPSYREHFKSEWHRFNLKRKMKNLPAITSEEAFLSLSVDDLQI